MKYLHSDITNRIIECAHKVHRVLGFGFLEKVYENALALELRKRNLKVEQQKPLIVRYDDEAVGEFLVDLLVEDKIITEVKAVKHLIDIHELQVLNYLKGSGLEVGLLINFAGSCEIKRKYFKLPGKSE